FDPAETSKVFTDEWRRPTRGSVMPESTRRSVLKALGVVGAGSVLVYGGMRAEWAPSASNGTTGGERRSAIRTGTEPSTSAETETPTETPTPAPSTWRLESLGRTTLSSPAGGFAEGVIRADGKYAAVGTRFSNQGSYLLDMRDPSAPEM